MKIVWTEHKRWIVGIVVAVLGLLLAVVIGISAFFVPEGRRFLGLDKPPQFTTVIKGSQEAQLPSSAQSASPQVITPTVEKSHTMPGSLHDKRAMKKTTQVKGNDNIAGTDISGNNNVVGNNNQSAPTVNAPNGIAITGGNVSNPTVNNFGPPPLQLSWSVSDTQPRAGFAYAKAVTVKSNTIYTPVSLAISCDADVEEVLPGVAAMNVRNGYVGNKKSWVISVGSPPITPDSPMTIVVRSNAPFNVLDVRKVEASGN